jgi:hypothetical protein
MAAVQTVEIADGHGPAPFRGFDRFQSPENAHRFRA